MIKKLLASFAALSVAFFFTFSFSHAETASSKMEKAFEKQYKEENYDFKNGSLELNHVQTINLDKPIKVKKNNKTYKISKITVATASFKTERDYIFFKDWNEYAYFAPDENLILTEGDVMKINQVKEFQKKYDSKVTLELGPIMIFMILIVVIPFAFGLYWKKKKYNSLDFKIKLLEAADQKR
ncbi:MAG: hypothetical protein ACO1OC_10490 [Tuberibacillus sp.]